MGVEGIQAEIEALQNRIERYTKTGQDVEPVYIEKQRTERRLAKEEAKLPVHPAYVSTLSFCCPGSNNMGMDADDRLVFGPIAQTIAAMSCISLGMPSSLLLPHSPPIDPIQRLVTSNINPFV